LFNYMQTEQDRREMRAGIKLTREIMQQKAFDPFRGEELAPGPAIETDAEIDGFVRAKAESAYHPSCTCRMGMDEMGLFDGSGRLHEVEGRGALDAGLLPEVGGG